MGHEINFNVFSTKKSKDEIYSIVNNKAIQNGDSHSGLQASIKWHDRCFTSYEEAEDFINEKDSGWYDQLAVKFRNDKNFKPSKTLEKLKERYASENKKYNDLYNKPHFENHSSALITCKNCTSKLATEYIRRTNFCPVCKADLRPISTLDRIKNMKDKLDKLYTQMVEKEKAERLKSIDKAEVFWLVKTEYHV